MRSIYVLAPVLVALLASWQPTFENYEPAVRDLDSVELFAGVAAITQEVSRLGFRAVAYDKSYSDTSINDLTSTAGFTRAVKLVLRLKPHGMLWGAPVCSSWVWIGRSQTWRSIVRPQGYHNTDSNLK